MASYSLILFAQWFFVFVCASQLLTRMAEAGLTSDARYHSIQRLVSQYQAARSDAASSSTCTSIQAPFAWNAAVPSSTSAPDAAVDPSDSAADDMILDVVDFNDDSNASSIAPGTTSATGNLVRQAHQLRANIEAYRRLSRNLPLTREFRAAITKLTDDLDDIDTLEHEGRTLTLPTVPVYRTHHTHTIHTPYTG
jgi:hypothetical protein